MKNIFLVLSILVSALFLAACGGASSKITHVSLPKFKAPLYPKGDIANSGVKIAFEPIIVEQNRNYSNDFENSVLRLRIDKEVELLTQNLEQQMQNIAKLKGYEIDQTNPAYKLQGLIDIYIDEKNVEKSSEWLSGDSVRSNLDLKFNSKFALIDANNPQNTTNIKSNTQLDSSVSLLYPVKSDGGVGMFKTTLSSVPTQLNKDLERPAFEIDKAFSNFYKNTLDTFYNNLPKADTSIISQDEGFKEFNTSENFENPQESQKFENSVPLNNLEESQENRNIIIHQKEKVQNGTSNHDGVVIFE